nr:HyaD/HybD family hydrogenase maturation endopeptidase [Sporolactobacillus laevolacticus]
MGIGNTLYSDEGVGVYALPLLEKALADVPNLEFVDGSTEGMQLLGPVENTQALIVLDAINANVKPGTIIKLEKAQIPSFNGIKMSVHQIGFQEVVSAAQLRERVPKKMVLFGIQPASLELGTELTDTARASIAILTNKVKQQINDWRSN